jgi:hypothetical protein
MKRLAVGQRRNDATPEFQRLGRLCLPCEAVNLSIFAICHLSQINGLAGMKSAKTGKIHFLYGELRTGSL